MVEFEFDENLHRLCISNPGGKAIAFEAYRLHFKNCTTSGDELVRGEILPGRNHLLTDELK